LAKLNDFVQRVKTAFFLIAAILIVLLVDNVLLPLVVMLFITFAMNEYLRFWHRKDIYPHTLAVLLPAYTVPWLYFFRIPAVFTSFLLFMFIALLSVMRYPGSRYIPNFLAEIAAAVLGITGFHLRPVSSDPDLAVRYFRVYCRFAYRQA
jgi:hypothetical protein